MPRTSRCFALRIIPFLLLVASVLSGQNSPTLNRSDITVGNLPVSLAVGDFNGDGEPDIAVLADTATNAVISIYLGNGDGTFTFETTFSSGFAATTSTSENHNLTQNPKTDPGGAAVILGDRSARMPIEESALGTEI